MVGEGVLKRGAVLRQGAIQLLHLSANSVFDLARAFGERCAQSFEAVGERCLNPARALFKRAVHLGEALLEGGVNLPRPLANHGINLARAVGQGCFERLKACTHCALNGAAAFAELAFQCADVIAEHRINFTAALFKHGGET